MSFSCFDALTNLLETESIVGRRVCSSQELRRTPMDVEVAESVFETGRALTESVNSGPEIRRVHVVLFDDDPELKKPSGLDPGPLSFKTPRPQESSGSCSAAPSSSSYVTDVPPLDPRSRTMGGLTDFGSAITGASRHRRREEAMNLHRCTRRRPV